jgi:hypothetical protein
MSGEQAELLREEFNIESLPSDEEIKEYIENLRRSSSRY